MQISAELILQSKLFVVAAQTLEIDVISLVRLLMMHVSHYLDLKIMQHASERVEVN